MIDSHAHLADPAFAADLEEVARRAAAAGVDEALCILAAGDAGEAEQARRLLGLWPQVGFAVGVHPHTAHEFAHDPAAAAERVREALAVVPRPRAIGEIGLDYHYDFSPPEAQRRVFRYQVRLARDMGLPVVIHTREADADTLEILRAEGKGSVAGVFHCFTGDSALATQALELGFCLSFSGIVTFPKAEALREVAKHVPLERLLVESDCPYLAPVPYRGRRNEPAWVRHVVETLAEVRGESTDRVAAAAVATFHAVFGPSSGRKSSGATI